MELTYIPFTYIKCAIQFFSVFTELCNSHSFRMLILTCIYLNIVSCRTGSFPFLCFQCVLCFPNFL